MRFDESRSIYQQIVEYVTDGILTGERAPEDRLPSVRELAVDLGVNPNTVQRAYTELQDRGLVHNQRGVGYFVSADARDQARARRRLRFERETLPGVFHTMEAIEYQFAELERAWRAYSEESAR